MQKVEIHSTSQHSAAVSDIVVREGPQVRLVFRPTIVDNRADPAACVRGRLLYQKKGKHDSWEDFDTRPLSSLKKGDQFQLELKAGELLPLLRALSGLYRIAWSQGVPQGHTQFVKLEEPLAKLIESTESELTDVLSANRENAVETVQRMLRWLAKHPKVVQRLSETQSELSEINALVGLANLRAIVDAWRNNSESGDESFWQQIFSTHSFVLSQVFAYPVVVIRERAYVGGKRLDNTQGALLDFLGQVSTSGEAVLIEIKTPQASLLGSEYRQGVFPPSRDLSGAISQVLHYRESLLHELHSLNRSEGRQLLGASPRCVVISGHAQRELDTDSKRRSFERFRERVIDVTVVTFDEVFDRVSSLIRLLESTPEGQTQISEKDPE
jgi:hypothetical protein